MYDPILILSLNLEVRYIYSYDDFEINSRDTGVVVTRSTYMRTEIKHTGIEASPSVGYHTQALGFHINPSSGVNRMPQSAFLSHIHNYNQICLPYPKCSNVNSKALGLKLILQKVVS